ncbi:MAG: hypothetical protein K2Q97_08300 [Burkholderiaceae bacterium]|nr:hypothetical protein [Burkholderiaceae bacterium]
MSVLSPAELSEYGRKLDALRMRHMQQAGLSGDLKLEAFVPATGIGKFDAVYSPQNNRLDITIKVMFDFVDDLSPGQSEEKWTRIEQMKFISEAHSYAAAWSERYLITCARPGWEKFFANVFVKFEMAPRTQQYYTVRVVKLRKYKSSGGIKHGETPHICEVNNWANQKDSTKSAEQLFNFKEGIYRGKLRDSLPDKSGDFVDFSANSKTLSTAEGLRLTRFANFINANRPPELQSIRIFVIGVTGKNDSFLKRGLSKERSASVVELLNSRIVGSDMAVVASGDEPWAKQALQLIKTRSRNPATGNGGVLLVVGTPPGTVREVPLNYVVMQHEIGHMIGLPDEYMGIRSTDTQTKMQLDAVVPSTYVASKLDTGGDNARLINMQGGMVKNLVTANVPAPLFMGFTSRADGEEGALSDRIQSIWEGQETAAAKKFGRGTDELKKWRVRNPQPVAPTGITTISSSIMHSGEDIVPAHYITFWSALSIITAGYVDPDEWKIVPTGKGTSTLRHFG